MTDRILAGAWWLAIMFLIALTGSGALYAAYRGVFCTFAAAYLEGAIFTLFSVVIGGACWFLCKHRTDLVCD